MKKLFFTTSFIFIFILSATAQQYNIVSSAKTFKDASRNNRNVSTTIYYPVNKLANQPKISFPVVVMGHGFVMGKEAYQNFYNELVPKGYIVVFVSTEGSVFSNHDAYSKDLAFMVGAIQAENNKTTSILYGIVANKTALLGHSMGGGAAVVAASLTNVETVVAFAPAKLRFNTLIPASKVKTEAIVFSGSRDGVASPIDNHIPIYENLGSACKYFISITGGAHCYFANPNSACDFGESTASSNIQVTRAQQQLITFRFLDSWLDYKLKGNLNSKQIFVNDLSSSQDITYRNDCNTPNISKTLSNENSSVVIYPNPASTNILVKTDHPESFQKVEFYDEYGQLLLVSKMTQIDVSGLKDGQYTVKIHSNNTVFTKKMIIQK